MKKLITRSIAAVALLPLLSFFCLAQEAFEVKWTMDYTQAGVSSHQNFTPANASLQGGANTFTLPTVYSPGGAIVVGYIIRPWPTKFSTARYMEFTFTANSYKYDISEIAFRLRRSADGPNLVKVRTSMDGFTADIAEPAVTGSGQFYNYSVPVHFSKLSNNTFSVRIYAYNAASIYGTLWFDEIIVRGKVHPIILPITLSYFRAMQEENAVKLEWEAVRELNAREYVVERSTNLIDFEPVSVLPATGESLGILQYQFTDYAPAGAASYYRLRCIDNDGSFAFSNTIDIVTSALERAWRVVPNPASPEKIIIEGGSIAPDQLRLTNSAGVSVPFKCELNGFKLMILTPQQPLPPGIYVLSPPNYASKEQVKILVR